MSIVQEGGPAFDPALMRRAAYGLAIAGVVVGAATLFAPSAPLAALDIVLALASAAMIVPAPELFEISGRRKTRGMNPLFAIPAGLVFVAGVTNDFVAISPLVIAAAAGALAALGAGLTTWRRPGISGPWQFLILMGLIGAAIGYGGVALIDLRFDASPEQPFRTAVASMTVSHGRGVSYYLHLAPWGPVPHESRVTVSKSLYDRFNPGDQACIGLRNGALAIPWYVVRVCPGPA